MHGLRNAARWQGSGIAAWRGRGWVRKLGQREERGRKEDAAGMDGGR